MYGLLRRSTLVVAVVSLALVAVLQAAAGPPGGEYTVTPLVSNIPGAAPLTDPDLVNGWGLARSATSPWWVADNGPDPSSSKSTLYTALARRSRSRSASRAARPAPSSRGLWATSRSQRRRPTLGAGVLRLRDRGGRIRAWRGGSRPRSSLRRQASPPGAVFKGLAIAQPTRAARCCTRPTSTTRRSTSSTAPGRTSRPPGAFVDPNLPAGYAPFGIQTIGSDIFVTYGKQDADAHDEVDGQASASSTSTTCRGTWSRGWRSAGS